MITKDSIDKIYEIAQVEEVIGDFVTLKKAGANYKGLSPFTQEKTPSFVVSPTKQIWKDFSSGKGGNVVAFLMEHEHFSYPEALRFLAKRYHIEIEETEQTDAEKEKANEKESLYLLSQYAKEYYEKNLWESEAGKAIGLSYFRERGFTDETIQHFDLGYALENKTAFYETATSDTYSDELLEQSGLIIKNEKGIIDRFYGRVIFPIKSMGGRIQGFGARILSSHTKAAKYLNSPESPIYNKSNVLYGLFEAKKSIAKEGSCYLVEGYTDVIQMAQAGIPNVVASSGTALTSEQVRLIKRLADQIVVLFDGDPAGLRAAVRGIDIILEQGIAVKVCTFPEGEDPDSFAKKNQGDALRTYLQDNAKDFIQFKTQLLLNESGDDPIKKATTVREIVQSIAKIPDTIQQEIYVQRCAELLNISEDVLNTTLAEEIAKAKRAASRNARATKPHLDLVKKSAEAELKEDPLDILEKQVLEILLKYGTIETSFEDVLLSLDEEGNLKEESKVIAAKVYEKIFLDLQQDEIAFVNDDFRQLYSQIMERLQANKSLQLEKLIAASTPETGQWISDVLFAEEMYSLHDWERKHIYVRDRESNVGQLVTETILTLRRYLIDKKIATLMENQLAKADVEVVQNPLLEEIMNYQSLKKLLSKKLNRVL